MACGYWIFRALPYLFSIRGSNLHFPFRVKTILATLLSSAAISQAAINPVNSGFEDLSGTFPKPNFPTPICVPY